MALRLVRSEVSGPPRPRGSQAHRPPVLAWDAGHPRRRQKILSSRDSQAPGIDLRIFRGLIFAAPFSLLMWLLIAVVVTVSPF